PIGGRKPATPASVRADPPCRPTPTHRYRPDPVPESSPVSPSTPPDRYTSPVRTPLPPHGRTRATAAPDPTAAHTAVPALRTPPATAGHRRSASERVACPCGSATHSRRSPGRPRPAVSASGLPLPPDSRAPPS